MLKKFVEQASRLPYAIDERGRYAMATKEKMRSQGIKSPDISDTCCFAFLAQYQPAESGQSSANNSRMRDFQKLWMKLEEESANAKNKADSGNRF